MTRTYSLSENYLLQQQHQESCDFGTQKEDVICHHMRNQKTSERSTFNLLRSDVFRFLGSIDLSYVVSVPNTRHIYRVFLRAF